MHRIPSPVMTATCASLAVASTITAQDLPSRRAHHALAYDPVKRVVLMTGGSTPQDGGKSSAFFNDLWAFDGRSWTPLPPSGNKLSGIRLAFDKKRGRMVSWGGYDGTGPSGELRALDASQWKSIGLYKDQRVAEAGFVYDVKRDRFVWFGGGGGGPTRGETFVYSADKWSRLETPGPSARTAHVMVYDERRDRIVLFGGTRTDAEGRPVSNLGDTWEFDGDRWTRIAASGPSPRAAAGATYDNRRGLVILYGGDSQGDFSAETWAWDGTSWKKLADTGPAPRGMTGERIDGAHWQMERNDEQLGAIGSPAGGSYATTGDLALFGEALRTGALVSKTTRDSLTTIRQVLHDAPGIRLGFGYGFEVGELRGMHVYGHRGGFPGARSRLDVYPELGFVVAIASNIDLGANVVGDHIRDLLLP